MRAVADLFLQIVCLASLAVGLRETIAGRTAGALLLTAGVLGLVALLARQWTFRTRTYCDQRPPESSSSIPILLIATVAMLALLISLIIVPVQPLWLRVGGGIVAGLVAMLAIAGLSLAIRSRKQRH